MKNLDKKATKSRPTSTVVNRSRSRSNSLKKPYNEMGKPIDMNKVNNTLSATNNYNNTKTEPASGNNGSHSMHQQLDVNDGSGLSVQQQVIKPIKSNEESGIFLSLLNIAHDTITHKRSNSNSNLNSKHKEDETKSWNEPSRIEPSQVDSDDLSSGSIDGDDPRNGAGHGSKFYKNNDNSFSDRLDSLINNRNAEEEYPQKRQHTIVEQGHLVTKGKLNPTDLSEIGRNTFDHLTSHSIHFASIRDSPVASLGNGDLSLDDFKDSRKDDDEISAKVKEISNDKRFKRRSTAAEVLSDQESIQSELNYSKLKYANKKRNKEFHQTFKKIPSSENLIDDFSCALSKDILVHGRLYLTENYLCFKSNILGWVTNLLIPLQEVVQIEKRSTAGLFPNGMVIRTLYQKYTFATFIYRDATFKLVTSVWHQVLSDNGEKRPILERESDESDYSLDESSDSKSVSDEAYQEEDDDSGKIDRVSKQTSATVSGLEATARDSEEEIDLDSSGDLGSSSEPELDDGPLDQDLNGNSSEEDDLQGEKVKDINGQEHNDLIPKDVSTFKGLPMVGPLTHEAEPLDYEKQSNDTFIVEDEFDGPLGAVFSILFGKDNSYYIKILKNQGNIQIEEEKITGLLKEGDERHYKYIKPLGGSIGPKQTSCIICDKVLQYNVTKAIVVEQTTSTPDVPSGNAFKIRTRIHLYWGENNHTKIYVVTSIEWTGKSWIKGPIEKGSIDGQKESMKILVDSVNEIIKNGDEGGKKQKRSRKKSENKRSKSISGNNNNDQEKNNKALEAEEAAKNANKSLTAQINGLAETIGSSIPISIPMITPVIMGYLIITLQMVMVIYGYNWLTGKHSTNVITIAKDSIVINNNKYLLTPSIENKFNDAKTHMNSQIQLWNWIRDKSGDKINLGSTTSSGSSVADDYLQRYKHQELQDIVRLTQLRLDQLKHQMER